MKYIVELQYTASIQVSVEADNEGSALDKARDVAEEADMAEFSLISEQESKIISID